jgi:Uncharacterised protein family (UPF0158)
MSDNNATDAYVTAEWIRRPLPDLGGLSPTDAAADAEGRKKLDDLLIELAGHHVRMRRLGLTSVNPDEIRKALGMEAAAHAAPSRAAARAVRAGPVKRNALLDELGTALTGGDVDSAAFFNVKTGAVEHFMHNLGDQENARIAQADADPDLKKVSPVTTEIRYGIMSDFIGMVDDIAFAGKLRSAISGKGAFRRFRETVDEDDGLRRRWLSYRTKRHYHLALDWLHKLGLNPSTFSLNPSDFDWEPSDAAVAAPARPHSPPEPIASEPLAAESSVAPEPPTEPEVQTAPEAKTEQPQAAAEPAAEEAPNDAPASEVSESGNEPVVENAAVEG